MGKIIEKLGKTENFRFNSLTPLFWEKIIKLFLLKVNHYSIDVCFLKRLSQFFFFNTDLYCSYNFFVISIFVSIHLRIYHNKYFNHNLTIKCSWGIIVGTILFYFFTLNIYKSFWKIKLDFEILNIFLFIRITELKQLLNNKKKM